MFGEGGGDIWDINSKRHAVLISIDSAVIKNAFGAAPDAMTQDTDKPKISQKEYKGRSLVTTRCRSNVLLSECIMATVTDLHLCSVKEGLLR